MSDLISKQRAIEAIDRFIPADPMTSDYTQGISVGLAIATRCIEEFSQENDDSSQGLVKDLISREEMLRTYQELCMNIACSECSFYFCDASTGDCLLEKWIHSLPSAEPKTPSNGSITSMNTEKMHVRTTDGLIRRQDVLHELEGCDYELKDWQRWKLKTMVRDIPSAEKAQLSGEDATKDATSDLISRQAAIDAPVKMVSEGLEWIPVYHIKNLPSAEPEIIRCKDCKWFGEAGCAVMIVDDSDKPTEDDYCSFAERRGEQE